MFLESLSDIYIDIPMLAISEKTIKTIHAVSPPLKKISERISDTTKTIKDIKAVSIIL